MNTIYTKFQQGHFIFAGPCALEEYSIALEVAQTVREVAEKHHLTAVFKSSFDKANRTSAKGFRGHGMAKGLEWLAKIKEEIGLPIVTDIHLP